MIYSDYPKQEEIFAYQYQVSLEGLEILWAHNPPVGKPQTWEIAR